MLLLLAFQLGLPTGHRYQQRSLLPAQAELLNLLNVYEQKLSGTLRIISMCLSACSLTAIRP